MKITVDNSNYLAAHGKKPSGTGLWAFDFSDGRGRWTTEFAPRPMPLTEAKRWAVKQARSLGCSIVCVAS